MRDKAADEKFIRETINAANKNATVYVTPNHYDGGYEVRIESRNVFVDYEMIDAKETTWAYEKD